jgi:hypothetical protein
MAGYWETRYRNAEMEFHTLKALTKKVPAGTWTPEYHELAEAIHTVGRDAFYVDHEAPENSGE